MGTAASCITKSRVKSDEWPHADHPTWQHNHNVHECARSTTSSYLEWIHAGSSFHHAAHSDRDQEEPDTHLVHQVATRAFTGWAGTDEESQQGTEQDSSRIEGTQNIEPTTHDSSVKQSDAQSYCRSGNLHECCASCHAAKLDKCDLRRHEGAVCAICTEPFLKEGNAVSHGGGFICPNGHEFHLACLGKWCQQFDANSVQPPTCPCCKCSIPQHVANWCFVDGEGYNFFLDLSTGDKAWDIPAYAIANDTSWNGVDVQ